MSKLDLKTKLFLYITGSKNLGTPKFEATRLQFDEQNAYDVYVFDSYEDYVNYFKLYINDVDEEIINKAIYTTGSKGQIVAFKGLMDRIITKEKAYEMYEKFDRYKTGEIHAKGKLTPMDKLKEYESLDICAPGEEVGQESNRCKFFDNCHDCLLEYLSYQDEYENTEYKTVNKENKKVLKRV